MTKKLLFVTTLLLVVAFVAFAADVTGKWTYEQPAGRQGGNPRQVTITLKQDGAKLTGSVPGMMGGGRGRGGAPADPNAPPPPPPADQEISNGKVDGNNISFEVKTSRGGNDFVTKYEGTLDGDSLKLKITGAEMGGGDPPPPTEVVAKRSTT